jgi:hypothetical protein
MSQPFVISNVATWLIIVSLFDTFFHKIDKSVLKYGRIFGY